MRISTSYMTQQSINSMLDQQSKLAETQNQVSTGKKQLHPSDDPVAAVKTLDLQRQISLSQQYQANANVAENKLSTTDGVLSSASDILQRIRDLSVQGLNDTNSSSSRQAIATEINQLNDSLVSLANSTDANGEYFFSGYKSDTQPFDTSTYAYNGDSNQRNIRVGQGALVAINQPGNQIFEGSTVAGGSQAIFQTIKDFATALNNNTVGTAPNNGDVLTNIDNVMSNVWQARTKTGTSLNTIDQQRAINTNTQTSMQSTLSQVQDLDYASAITKLNLQSTGLQAAQQAYVKVQGLSLFNYL